MRAFIYTFGTIGLGYWAFKDAFILEVPEGHLALTFDRLQARYNEKVLTPGKHYFNPLIEAPQVVDCRPTPIQVTSLIPTTDKIMTEITYEGKFKPEEDQLYKILISFGPNFGSLVSPSLIHSVLKQEVKKYDSHQIIANKEKIEKEIVEIVTSEGKKFNIIYSNGNIIKWDIFNDASLKKEQNQ